MIEKGNEYLAAYNSSQHFPKPNDESQHESMKDRALELMNLSFNRIPADQRSVEEKFTHSILNISKPSTNKIINGILDLNDSKYKGKTKKLLRDGSDLFASLQANANENVIDLAIEAHTNVTNDLKNLNPVVISDETNASICDLFSAAKINKNVTCTISKNS